MIIKRVVAVEFDWVVRNDGLYTEVPKGHCWVEGDNQNNSLDSNVFGPAPLALITARAFFVIWPFESIRKLKSELPEAARKRVRLRPYTAA